MAKHCETCRCHEFPLPEHHGPNPPKKGDVIKNRLTGEFGVVESVQEENLPWHEGGVPFVKGSGYWHYYDITCRFASDEVKT